MTLKPSSTNTTSSTNTAYLHEKPADTIEKNANNSKKDQNSIEKFC